jgi:hypothetical protein
MAFSKSWRHSVWSANLHKSTRIKTNSRRLARTGGLFFDFEKAMPNNEIHLVQMGFFGYAWIIRPVAEWSHSSVDGNWNHASRKTRARENKIKEMHRTLLDFGDKLWEFGKSE